MRAIDKLDRLGGDGVAALLGAGRKDESGDFTKGAGLESPAVNAIINFVGAKDIGVSSAQGVNNTVTLTDIEAHLSLSPIGLEGLAELQTLSDFIERGRYEDRIVIDPSVVRGLEYYTGPVFEAELTAPIKDERGQPIRLGSVVSGGRYDGLVERFTGEKVPATGISIGVSRLLFGLQRLGKFKTAKKRGPVVVLVFGRPTNRELSAAGEQAQTS